MAPAAVHANFDHQNTRISRMFKHIGLIASNRTSSGIGQTLAQVRELLEARNIDISYSKSCEKLIPELSGRTAKDNNFCVDCDLVIVIGGDGTMLSVAHTICDKNIPLLGINRGHLGFLADIPADDVSTHLAKILDGHYVEEKRFMLSSEIIRNDKVVYTGNAFNDVVIQKGNIARLVQFDTFINDNFLLTQRSDGMIISTPTGSTAYALSGGGPILYPTLDALVLVPICPHTLSIRPIVVDGNSVIEIRIGDRDIDSARLTCDGDTAGDMQSGDRVRVSKKDTLVRLIHPADHDHFSILRAKLHWGR